MPTHALAPPCTWYAKPRSVTDVWSVGRGAPEEAISGEAARSPPLSKVPSRPCKKDAQSSGAVKVERKKGREAAKSPTSLVLAWRKWRKIATKRLCRIQDYRMPV
eukprot:1156514-Pelagomonas_calceolata.AAC.5